MELDVVEYSMRKSVGVGLVKLKFGFCILIEKFVMRDFDQVCCFELINSGGGNSDFLDIKFVFFKILDFRI